jgi:NAD(P)-dependent dehydrogenase (short-subunit alcohol dehydrogenase family)
MNDFNDMVLLVTGASGGLGAAIAVAAAKRGACAVVVHYASSREAAEATAEAVRKAGAEAVLVQGDVAEEGDCRRIAAAGEKFGRIDALVNNAGSTKHVPRHADLDALSRDDFLALYSTNVVGPFQMLRACRTLLEAAPAPSVLMVSSIAGVAGIGSSVAYAASKGALNTMTLSLARALAPKIRVNAICPGFMDTPWFSRQYDAKTVQRIRDTVAQTTPLQRAATAGDVADPALFLISQAARNITGETMMVDAGMHLGFAPLRAR